MLAYLAGVSVDLSRVKMRATLQDIPADTEFSYLTMTGRCRGWFYISLPPGSTGAVKLNVVGEPKLVQLLSPSISGTVYIPFDNPHNAETVLDIANPNLTNLNGVEFAVVYEEY